LQQEIALSSTESEYYNGLSYALYKVIQLWNSLRR
jgi:hypothetical protein